MANATLASPSPPDTPAIARAYDGMPQRNAPKSASEAPEARILPTAPALAFQQAENDSERFMQIVQNATTVSSHYDLFLFLQSKIQYFIPHQIMIAAWGDFHSPTLKFDVVSALPGVRTDLLAECGIESMIKDYFKRYLAGERRPQVIKGASIDIDKHVSCGCALHTAMKEMSSVRVFGVRNERDSQESLYICINPVRVKNCKRSEYFSFLVNSVASQIDVAFRKVAALKRPDCALAEEIMPMLDSFSEREQQVLKWLAQGKSNAEIAEKLCISVFTVKNHTHRIYKKLAANNRTEAVGKFRQLCA